MEVYHRGLSLILWRSFIFCHVSFMVVFIMVMGNIKESGTQRILQLQDTHAFVGVYFQYHLWTSMDNSSEIEVTEAGRACLPSWLYYNMSSYALQGVPMAVHEGFTYIKLTAPSLPSLSNEDVFAINVIHPRVAATINLDPKVVTDKTESKPQQDENGVHYCKPMETRFSVTLMLALPLESTTVGQMVEVVKNFSAFISRTPYEVVLSAKRKFPVHSERDVEVASSLREIEGNIRWDSQISWHISCNTFLHAEDLKQVLNHNIKSGTFQSILGCPVTGWLLLATFPKKKGSSRRQKRQVDVFQTPFITPTVTKMLPSAYVTTATSLVTSSVSSTTVNFYLSTLSLSEPVKSSPSTFLVSKARSDDTNQLTSITQESSITFSSIVMTSRPHVSSFRSHLQTPSRQVISSSVPLTSSSKRFPNTLTLSPSPETSAHMISSVLFLSTDYISVQSSFVSNMFTSSGSDRPSSGIVQSPSLNTSLSLAVTTSFFTGLSLQSQTRLTTTLGNSKSFVNSDFSLIYTSSLKPSPTSSYYSMRTFLTSSSSVVLLRSSQLYSSILSFSSPQVVTIQKTTIPNSFSTHSSQISENPSFSSTSPTIVQQLSSSMEISVSSSLLFLTAVPSTASLDVTIIPSSQASSQLYSLALSTSLFSTSKLDSPSTEMKPFSDSTRYYITDVESSKTFQTDISAVTSTLASRIGITSIYPTSVMTMMTPSVVSRIYSSFTPSFIQPSLAKTSNIYTSFVPPFVTHPTSPVTSRTETITTQSVSSITSKIQISSTPSVASKPTSPVTSRIYSSFSSPVIQPSSPFTSKIDTSFTSPPTTHLTPLVTTKIETIFSSVMVTQSTLPSTSRTYGDFTPSSVTQPTVLITSRIHTSFTTSLITSVTSHVTSKIETTFTPYVITHSALPVTSKTFTSHTQSLVIQPSSSISRVDTSITSPLSTQPTLPITTRVETLSTTQDIKQTLPVTSSSRISTRYTSLAQTTLHVTSRNFTSNTSSANTLPFSGRTSASYTATTQTTLPVTSRTSTSFSSPAHTTLPFPSRTAVSYTSSAQTAVPVTSRNFISYISSTTLPFTGRTSVSYISPSHTFPVTSRISTSYTSPAHTFRTSAIYTSPAQTTLTVTSETSASYTSPTDTLFHVSSRISGSYTPPTNTMLPFTRRTSLTPSEVSQLTSPFSTKIPTTFTSDSIGPAKSTTSVFHSSPFKSLTSFFYLSSTVNPFTSAITGSTSNLQSQSPSVTTTPKSLISFYSGNTISNSISSEVTVQIASDSATQAMSLIHSLQSIHHSSMISNTERMTAKTMLRSTVQASSGRISPHLSSVSSNFRYGVSNTVAIYSTSNVSQLYSTMRTSLLPSRDVSETFGSRTVPSSLLASMISSVQPTPSQSITSSLLETSSVRVLDSTQQLSSRITFSMYSHSRPVSTVISSGNSQLPTTKSFGSNHVRQPSATPVLTNLPSMTRSLVLSSLTLQTVTSSLPTMYSSNYHSSYNSKFSSQYVSSSYFLPATTIASPVNVTTTETSPYTVVPVPILLNPIDHIALLRGEVFQFVIPADTFYDRWDGDTRNLSLFLLDSNYQSVGMSSWIFLDEEKQSLEGLIVGDDLVDGVHQFYLAAKNSAGYVAYDALTLVIMENNAEYNHQFQIILSLNYFILQDKFYYVHKFFQALSLYYGGGLTEINVFSVLNGSVIITYSNNSIPVTYCDSKGLEDLLQLMVHESGSINPLFQEIVGREFPIGSVKLKLIGVCSRYVTTSSPGVTFSPQTSNGRKLWLLLSTSLVALFIFIFLGFVICLFSRSKHPGEEFLLSEEKPLYIGCRKPTVLENERYIGRKPRRNYPAAILPDDISPFKLPREEVALPLKKLPSDPTYNRGSCVKLPPHYPVANSECKPPAYQPPPSYPSHYLEDNEFV